MMPTNADWPFLDPPNVAVFTSKRIIYEDAWVYYVTHDEGDGAWQFHPHDPTPENEAAVVSLKEMVSLDDSLRQLANLPVGWHAWRQSPNAKWERAPKS